MKDIHHPAFLRKHRYPGYANAWQILHPVTLKPLKIIATDAYGWDHVSISTPDRVPLWEEMEFVKRLFFKPDEAAMQLHVPPSDHVNCHPFALHLWRPNDGREIPRPPAELVL